MSENAYAPRPLRAAVAHHVGGGTPPRQLLSHWKGRIPWASVKDFSEQAEVIADTQEHISVEGLNASASNLIPAGTPLVCTRMAVGRAAMPSVAMAINQDVKALFPAAGVSAAYLLKVLQFIQPKAEAQAVGSTVKGIRIQDYLDISVPLADPNSQPLIAAVLHTLDTVIHETEAIIGKLKAIKLGLLHDLLTRGIAANGELRPPQAQAPHLYKESPLGWIPRDWSSQTLRDVSSRITDGTHQAVTTVAGGMGDTPFLFVSCVRDGKVAWDKAASISRRDYLRISKGREPRAGVVLYTAVGSYGYAAEVSDAREFAFQRHIACIYPDASKVIAGFMPLVLNCDAMRRYADRVAIGNAQKTITLGELARYPFNCPDRAEQSEIVGRLHAANERLASETKYFQKLRLQKSGLMDDLLTGRVRTTALPNRAISTLVSA
jgi:type I restriction enzyme S subunit